MPARFATAMTLALLSNTAVKAQQFDHGNAQTIVIGDPVPISLSGLRPGAVIEITGQRVLDYPSGGRQTSYASFVADSSGKVDLAHSRPVTGSYDRADPSGLFWSMAPNYPFAFGTKANEVRLTAYVASRPVAHTTITFLPTSIKFSERSVPNFPGAFLVEPDVPGPRPVVIVLGGGEGNDYLARAVAPRLAGHGFAVLALPSYSPRNSFEPNGRFPALPSAYENLPIDRLDAAYRWLRLQPRIDSRRVALYGHSRGAELALLAAAHFRWTKAVAAIVPTDVVNVGWGGGDGIPRSPYTLKGQPVPYVAAPMLPRILERLDAGLPGEKMVDAYEDGRRSHPDAAWRARIPVEQFHGALLVAGAGMDADWASARAAQNIAERRSAHGLKTTLLIYDKAGHGLTQSGWEPPSSGLGGEPSDNVVAQQHLWQSTIQFLTENLHPEIVRQP